MSKTTNIIYCPICKYVPLERVLFGTTFIYRCPNCGFYYRQFYGKLSPPLLTMPKEVVKREVEVKTAKATKGVGAFVKFLTDIYGMPMSEYRKLPESKREKIRELYRAWLRNKHKYAEEEEEEEGELSEVDRIWMDRVAERLSRNSEKWKKEIYKHLYLLLMGQEEYWDAVQWIRSISGYHIEDIHRVMREELDKLPELKREIRRQGVILPFEREYTLEMYRKSKKSKRGKGLVF